MLTVIQRTIRLLFAAKPRARTRHIREYYIRHGDRIAREELEEEMRRLLRRPTGL